jgi:hypothetical protein
MLPTEYAQKKIYFTLFCLVLFNNAILAISTKALKEKNTIKYFFKKELPDSNDE